MKRWMLLLLLLCTLPAMAAPPVRVVEIGPEISEADASGVCTITGIMLPEWDIALVCALDHDEGVPLTASIETGSLDVQGWLLHATGREVLIALRNESTTPISLFAARVVLGRMVPATPQHYPHGYPTRELCILQAISDRDDVHLCNQWKSETETPAVAAAGVE